MEPTTTAAADRELAATPSGKGFRANPEERLARTRAVASLARTGRGLALLAAFAFHALVLFLVIFENHWDRTVTPAEREIPVEIVVEKPKPKPQPPAPPAPKPEPAIKTNPLDEDPARDAPRAANDEKVERQAADDKTKAPTDENTAKAPGAPSAPDQPAPQPRASEAKPTPQPPKPQPDKAADAGEGALDANSQSAEAEAARAAPPKDPDMTPTFVGEPLPNWSKGGKFSTFDALPDIKLGSIAEPTKIAGGKAKSTYLTVLYGMIMAQVHYSAAEHGKAEGELVFVVDGTGRVVQRQIARPSGSRELDAAAFAAITAAEPFPRPPQGLPVRLRFTYGAN